MWKSQTWPIWAPSKNTKQNPKNKRGSEAKATASMPSATTAFHVGLQWWDMVWCPTPLPPRQSGWLSLVRGPVYTKLHVWAQGAVLGSEWACALSKCVPRSAEKYVHLFGHLLGRRSQISGVYLHAKRFMRAWVVRLIFFFFLPVCLLELSPSNLHHSHTKPEEPQWFYSLSNLPSPTI